MHIVRIELTRVRVPLRRAYLSSRRLLREYEKTIFRVSTDTGLEGLGESAGDQQVFDLAQNLASRVMGADPLNLNALRAALAPTCEQHAGNRNPWIAMGGLEMACWDLAGKRYELPVHRLLGGAVCERVAAVCEMSAGPFAPDVDAAQAREFFADLGNVDRVVESALRVVRRDGYRALKLKSTATDVRWDIAVMGALREALGPQVQLRHDANAGYTIAEALRVCSSLDALGLQWFEDPAPGLDGMSRVRREIRTPLATNMCVVGFEQLAPCVRLGAVDVVGVDPFHWGGLANARDLIAACSAFGLGVFGHCFFDLGITTAANIHLAAASPRMLYGVDTCAYLQAADVVAGGTLQVQDGELQVPDAPGLGVSIDPLALNRYAFQQIVLEH